MGASGYSNGKRLARVVLIAIAVVGLWLSYTGKIGGSGDRPADSSSPSPSVGDQQPLKGVRTMPMSPVTQIPFFTQGIVKADLSMDVKSPVDSRVEWVHASLKEGGVFKKGEVMLKLDSGEFESMLADKKLELEQARLDYSNDRIEAIKSVKTKEGDNGAESDLVMRLPVLRVSDAKVNARRAGVKAAQELLDSVEVKAPYDCIVTGVSSGLYAPVKTGEVLYSIVSLTERKVVAPLALDVLNMMDAKGGRLANYLVTVSSFDLPGGKWLGKVRGIDRFHYQDKTVDLIAGLYSVNDSVYLPFDLPVSLVIDVELTKPCYMIPIKSFADDDHVWVIDQDHKLVKRKVTKFGRLGAIIYVTGDETMEKDVLCISFDGTPEEGMQINPEIISGE